MTPPMVAAATRKTAAPVLAGIVSMPCSPRHAHRAATAPPRRRLTRRRAFTLLEVILALVILAAALATFGEIMQLANRNALNARAETQAQILAESVMDQLLAGAIDVTQVSRQSLATDGATPWLYSVNIGTSALDGVQPVEVIVEQDLEPQFNPVKFRLLRWLPTYVETPETGGSAGGQQGGGAGQGSTGSAGAGGGGGTTP